METAGLQQTATEWGVAGAPPPLQPPFVPLPHPLGFFPYCGPPLAPRSPSAYQTASPPAAAAPGPRSAASASHPSGGPPTPRRRDETLLPPPPGAPEGGTPPGGEGESRGDDTAAAGRAPPLPDRGGERTESLREILGFGAAPSRGGSHPPTTTEEPPPPPCGEPPLRQELGYRGVSAEPGGILEGPSGRGVSGRTRGRAPPRLTQPFRGGAGEARAGKESLIGVGLASSVERCSKDGEIPAMVDEVLPPPRRRFAWLACRVSHPLGDASPPPMQALMWLHRRQAELRGDIWRLSRKPVVEQRVEAALPTPAPPCFSPSGGNCRPMWRFSRMGSR